MWFKPGNLGVGIILENTSTTFSYREELAITFKSDAL